MCSTEKILFDAIRLLNFFDVSPRLLGDERCCGHDLLWSGEQKHFGQVARLNAERLNSSGHHNHDHGLPGMLHDL